LALVLDRRSLRKTEGYGTTVRLAITLGGRSGIKRFSSSGGLQKAPFKGVHNTIPNFEEGLHIA
jgi:hypothetical protein